MSARSAVALITLALLALGAAFALGMGTARARQDRALAAVTRTSDSLRAALASRVAVVARDTVVRDSIVLRWKRYTDTLPGRVDTLPGRVDTVSVPAVIQIADAAITTLDTLHRRCVATLLTCEQTARAATDRADREHARADAFEAAARNARKHVTAERAVCAVSAVTNVLQWRFSK